MPRGVADIDQYLQARLVLPRGQGLGFGFGGFAGCPASAGENISRIAQQIAKGIDVVDAVKHDLDVLALIDPRPETPVGLAVNLNRTVGGGAEPALIDQEARATDASVPAHLLVDRNLHLGALREFHAANRF